MITLFEFAKLDGKIFPQFSFIIKNMNLFYLKSLSLRYQNFLKLSYILNYKIILLLLEYLKSVFLY